MTTEAEETPTLHGGRLVARRLKAYGVSKLFTLTGGHLFSIYDGCRAEGIDLVDVRHESSAAFAAEGWAKVTREPGVAALTAGPGVTNGMSAMASAHAEPLADARARRPRAGDALGPGLAAGDRPRPVRAPGGQARRDRGSTAEIPGLLDEAWDAMRRPHTGPGVPRLPARRRVHGGRGAAARPIAAAIRRRAVDARALERAVALLRDAERPVIMAGNGLYWAHGEHALRELAEAAGIPVFLNGLARGCLPADHELFFARARSAGLKGADVALVIGVPMDFRLGFGGAFGEETELIVLDGAEPEREHPRPVAAELYGDVAEALRALAAAGGGDDTRAWVEHLRGVETEKRAAEEEQFADDRAPLHPMRLYRELAGVLDRDAILIGDGGDFVSYAGRVVDTYEPGCWLDPGPFGCLGCGPGYALAAKLAHPDRQVVLLLGDGAFGFAGMEFDTLARHGVQVVAVIGNNGIWALEKHPMEYLYGYSVAADLTPGDALRPRGRGARLPGRAGARARRAAAGARARVLGRPARRS